MPLYQYRCRECQQELEIRQSFSEDPLELCPNCGAPQGLFRVIQPAGVVFKGSGFYINDSKGSKRELTTPAKKAEGEASTPAADSATKEATTTKETTSTTEKTSPAPSSSPAAT